MSADEKYFSFSLKMSTKLDWIVLYEVKKEERKINKWFKWHEWLKSRKSTF